MTSVTRVCDSMQIYIDGILQGEVEQLRDVRIERFNRPFTGP